MTPEQRVVGIGAASGVATMAAALAIIYRTWPINISLINVTARLAYTLQMNVFAVLPLTVGIIVVGNDRFRGEAIDPTSHKESLSTEINARVVDNAMQQCMLFLVGTLALSVNCTLTLMRAIPAATIVFVIARIAFWVGYRIHPLYRAFGMAASIYLNIAIISLAIWESSGR